MRLHACFAVVHVCMCAWIYVSFTCRQQQLLLLQMCAGSPFCVHNMVIAESLA
jgi:hypothetical protein